MGDNFHLTAISFFLFCFIGQLVESTDISKPIVRGSFAQPGWFPHQAYLWSQNRTCGGSLISERWVLSAAHCVSTGVFGSYQSGYAFDQVDVYLGYTNLQDSSYTEHHTVYKQSIIINEGYWKEVKNICALNLPRAARISRTLAPIALRDYLQKPYPTYENLYGLVSGWGETENGAAQLHHLRYKWVWIESNRKCVEKLNYEGHYPWFVCASSHSICNGDGGGPLTYNDGGKTYLIGITNFIYDSCTSGIPTSHARISYNRDWIRKVTGV